MFFDVFQSLCKKKGVSCKRAAEDIGLSNSITTKWKQTGATPSGDTLNKIASYFNVTTDYLLGNRDVQRMNTLAIIKRIELRLTEIGMSKSDFYKNSGISSASYSQWNTGLYSPSEKKLKSAARCLGVTFEYLRDGGDIPLNITNSENVLTTVLDDAELDFYNTYKELDERDRETVRRLVYILRRE